MELGLMVILGSGYSGPKPRLVQMSIGSIQILSVLVLVHCKFTGIVLALDLQYKRAICVLNQLMCPRPEGQGCKFELNDNSKITWLQ